jgi:hypothetical protein
MKILINETQLKKLKKYLKNFITENDEWYYSERNNPKAPWNQNENIRVTTEEVFIDFLFKNRNDITLIIKADIVFPSTGDFSIKNIEVIENTHNIKPEKIKNLLKTREVYIEIENKLLSKVSNNEKITPQDREILIQDLSI